MGREGRGREGRRDGKGRGGEEWVGKGKGGEGRGGEGRGGAHPPSENPGYAPETHGRPRRHIESALSTGDGLWPLPRHM